MSKNLFSSNKYGNADFQSNLKVHNYDTNKFTKFLVNDFGWKYKNEISDSPFGILVLVGKFPTGKNYIVYESPDGSCWRANIQPNGKNIVMFRVL